MSLSFGIGASDLLEIWRYTCTYIYLPSEASFFSHRNFAQLGVPEIFSNLKTKHNKTLTQLNHEIIFYIHMWNPTVWQWNEHIKYQK